MYESIIGLGYNYDELDAGTKKVVQNLLSVLDVATQLNGYKINVGVDGVGTLNDTLQKVKQTNDQLTGSWDAATRAQEANNRAAIQAAQLAKAQAEAIKAEADALKAKTQAQNTQTQASGRTEAATRREQKALDDLANEYKQLSIASQEASLRAKNMAIVMGQNHPLAIQAAADAKRQADYLKQLDASTGTYNRNVGNYGSALTGYANVLRGLRGPTKLLGEALGIGAQQADQLRLVIEHSLQGLAAYFRGKSAAAKAAEENASALTGEAAATEANTEIAAKNVVARNAQLAAEEAQTAATEARIVATNLQLVEQDRLVESIAAEAVNQAFLNESSAANLAARIEIAAAATAEAAAAEANAIALESQSVAAAQAAVTAQALAAAEIELAVATTTTSTAMRIFATALKFTGIGLLIAGIVALVIAFKESAKYAKIASEANDALKESLEASNGEYQKAVKNVNELKINIDLAKKGFLDKSEVLKEYNDTIGKTTGKVDDLDAAEKALIKNADAYVRVTLYKAAANIELDKAAKSLALAQETKNKSDAEFANNFEDKFGANVFGNPSIEEQKKLAKQQAVNEKIRKEKKLKEDQDAAERSLAIARDFQTKAAELAKQFGFDFFGGKETEKDKKIADFKNVTDEVFKYQEDAEKRQFEATKARNQEIINGFKEVAKNSVESFQTRADATEKAAQAQEHLNNITAAFNIGSATRTGANLVETQQKNEAEAIKKAKEEKRSAVDIEAIQTQTAANIVAINKDTAGKIAEINSTRLRDNAKAEGESVAEVLKLQQDGFTAAKKLYADLQKDTASGLKNELQQGMDDIQSNAIASELENVERLNSLFRTGQIDVKTYNKELAKIKANLEIATLTDQLKLLNKERDKLAINPLIAGGADKDKQLGDLDAQIAKAKLALDNAQHSSDADQSDPKKKGKLLGSKEYEFTKEGADLVNEIGDAQFEKEKNRIQQKIDLLQEATKTEIDGIQRSSLSAQQKAAEIAIVEAKANEQKLAYQKQQKEQDIKKAKFDKEIAILKATAELTLAIIDGNVVGAVAGGVALAKLIATPIPSYAEGTENHPGGFARYGEAGAEWIEKPNQKPFLAVKETISYLPKGTKVRPILDYAVADLSERGMNNQFAQMAYYNSIIQGQKGINEERIINGIADAVVKSGNAVERAIKKQVFPTPPAPRDFSHDAYIYRMTRQG